MTGITVKDLKHKLNIEKTLIEFWDRDYTVEIRKDKNYKQTKRFIAFLEEQIIILEKNKVKIGGSK
jgi:hypothetical protein